jgi:hypothetical protein
MLVCGDNARAHVRWRQAVAVEVVKGRWSAESRRLLYAHGSSAGDCLRFRGVGVKVGAHRLMVSMRAYR